MKAQDKNSFIMYHDQKEIFEKLNCEEAGKLIKAIFDYETTGNLPELSELLSYIIIPIKQMLDRNRVKYNEIKAARQEAGSIGGKQRVANQANATFAKQNVANQAKPSVHVNVNDNDNDNVNDKYILDFESFWSFYPKRIGGNNKIGAFRNWKSRLKEKYLPTELIDAAKFYQIYCNQTGITNTDYVIKASNFLGRDKHFLINWEDEANAARNKQSTKPKSATEHNRDMQVVIQQRVIDREEDVAVQEAKIIDLESRMSDAG